MRLLYKTTCWTCDTPIAASTTIWWDDDHRHATCTACVAERTEPPVEGSPPALQALDARARRRREIVRGHRHRAPRPTPARRTAGLPR